MLNIRKLLLLAFYKSNLRSTFICFILNPLAKDSLVIVFCQSSDRGKAERFQAGILSKRKSNREKWQRQIKENEIYNVS